MRRYLLPALVGFLGALLGVLLTLAAVHLYQDHQLLHALANIEAQRQQAAQKPVPEAR